MLWGYGCPHPAPFKKREWTLPIPWNSHVLPPCGVTGRAGRPGPLAQGIPHGGNRFPRMRDFHVPPAPLVWPQPEWDGLFPASQHGGEKGPGKQGGPARQGRLAQPCPSLRPLPGQRHCKGDAPDQAGRNNMHLTDTAKTEYIETGAGNHGKTAVSSAGHPVFRIFREMYSVGKKLRIFSTEHWQRGHAPACFLRVANGPRSAFAGHGRWRAFLSARTRCRRGQTKGQRRKEDEDE